MSKPTLVTINHDDDYARYVGYLPDGRQFFLTTPFVPAIGNDAGREFIALYLFDEHGVLLEAQIEDLGIRSELDMKSAQRKFDQQLKSLGPLKYGRIEIQPFAIERFGTEFGLVLRQSEEDAEGCWVEVQPGSYMAFREPWDSGEYYT